MFSSIEEGSASNAAQVKASLADFDHLVTGRLECRLDRDTVTLDAGDSIILRAANHEWFNPGDEIGVTLKLPGEAPPLSLRAVVRHTRGFHHGCQFLEPYRDQRYFLRQLVTDVIVAV